MVVPRNKDIALLTHLWNCLFSSYALDTGTSPVSFHVALHDTGNPAVRAPYRGLLAGVGTSLVNEGGIGTTLHQTDFQFGSFQQETSRRVLVEDFDNSMSVKTPLIVVVGGFEIC